MRQGFGITREWLASDEMGVQLEDAPTIFGPASVSIWLENRSFHANISANVHSPHALQNVVVSLRAAPVEWGSSAAASVKIAESPAASPTNGLVEFSGELLAKGKVVSVVASFP